jgi:hypothetical protein
VAAVTATAPGQAPITHSSNPVEVEEGVEPCTSSAPFMSGASGNKLAPFTVRLHAGQGAKQITIYLDGRKFKTMKRSQAKHGIFTFKIDTRKLSYGLHKLKVKVPSTNPKCSATLASRFADPRPTITPG